MCPISSTYVAAIVNEINYAVAMIELLAKFSTNSSFLLLKDNEEFTGNWRIEWVGVEDRTKIDIR